MGANAPTTRIAAFVERWWVFLAQGIVLLVMAAFAFIRPGLLLAFIGGYAVVDGLLKVFAGIREERDAQSRWLALLIGVLSILAGLVIWINPGFAAEVITSLVAVWGIVVGALLIVWAARLRREFSDEWLLVLFGVISILFGVLVFVNVQAGYLTLQWIFGLYAIAGGILAIVLAFRIRGIGKRLGAGR